MSDSLISSGVNVASNEYLTKFSINRNFVKLISNDAYLSSKVSDDKSTVYSYNPYKTYAAGDLIFFKTELTSQNTYLLSSLHSLNSAQPLCITNVNNDVVVIDGPDWKIVGIPALEELNGRSPTDVADEYVISSHAQFEKVHQDNVDLSAHPLGKFCRQDSTVLFSDITNIDEDRSTFFYPYKVQKLHADNTIIDGYMRKWDNGIIEYDIIFKVGYVGQTEEGYDLIEANNLNLIRRNYNYLYFKDKKDYTAFQKGGDYQAMVNNQKQVNLNKTLNAYAGQIDFPEEFKDLNYMVFSSNVKNITTRTYNTKNEVIVGYDYRLSVVGLTIESHLTSQDEEEEEKIYRSPVDIPLSVENIASQALADIKSDYPYVSFNILSDACLVNIDDEAFRYSEMTSITIPYATRRIGQEAFANCEKLKEVTFYVHDDKRLQVKIEQDAFMSTPSLTSINIIYDPKEPEPFLFASNALLDISEEDRRLSAYTSEKSLEEKLRDFDVRTYIYGISPSFDVNNIHVYNKTAPESSPASFKSIRMPLMTASSPSLGGEESSNTGMVTIDVKQFIKELKTAKSPSKLMAAKPLFGASGPSSSDLSDYFGIVYDEGSGTPIAISSWNRDTLTDDFDFNASELLKDDYATVTAINDFALSTCSHLTSATLGSPLESVGKSAFERCSNINSIRVDKGVREVKERAFADSGNINNIILSCSDVISYDKTAFQGTSIGVLSILPGSIMNYENYVQSIVADASKLCIDMTGCLFGQSFLSGSSITEIHLDNIMSGAKKEFGTKELTSFRYNALSGCNVNVISAENGQQISAISSVFIDPALAAEGVLPRNLLGIKDGALVKASYTPEDPEDPPVFNSIVISGEITTIPSFLIINDQLHVVSCDFSIGVDEHIFIPQGCTTICADAFIPPPEAALLNDDESTYTILSIDIPNSISSIGDYAFANNTNLNMLSIAPANTIRDMGRGIISSCSNLAEFEALSA